MTDLTKEAGEGFDFHRYGGGQNPSALGATCPYLGTSPSAMAWYVGLHLARQGFPRPGHPSNWLLSSSRGDTFRLHERGKRDPRCEVVFRWHPDNTITEEA